MAWFDSKRRRGRSRTGWSSGARFGRQQTPDRRGRSTRGSLTNVGASHDASNAISGSIVDSTTKDVVCVGGGGGGGGLQTAEARDVNEVW